MSLLYSVVCTGSQTRVRSVRNSEYLSLLKVQPSFTPSKAVKDIQGTLELYICNAGRGRPVRVSSVCHGEAVQPGIVAAATRSQVRQVW